MRLGNLAVTIGLVTAMSSPGLSALGLGEITLHSTLNQPLDAEIKLLQTRDLDSTEILAGLASNDAFKKAGIERNYFLTGLKFTVDLKAPGGPVLRVRSDRQVQEPYLNFLVETRWPSGRILREYTLLMDLPVFTEDAAPAVQAARPARPKPQNTVQRRPAEPQPSARPEPQPEPRQQVQAEPESTSSYGPVGANETLWGIAKQVRPGRGVSIQQTMLAIQRLNPDAFIDGNINRLRRGQVLRIPTESEVSSLSARAAIAEVAQQNTDWSGNANGDIGAPIDAGASSSRRSASSSQPSGRVTLASGNDSLGGSSSRGGSSGQAELSQALEQLDKSQRENTELKSRLSDLEAQIETMERLVEVSSEQMRALQLAATENAVDAEAGDASSSDVIDPLNDAYKDSLDDSQTLSNLVGDSEADANDPAASTEEQLAENAVDEAAEPVAKAEPKPKPKKKVAAVVSTPKPEPTFLDIIMENLLWIGGGLVAVLVGVWAFLRRRSGDEEEDDTLEPQFDSAPLMPADAESDEEESMPEAGGDVLSEADIYIAYGKFDQAEALLQEHLANNAEDSEARLKLLEVYSESKNYTGFDEQAEVLDVNADDHVLSRIASLREAMGGPENASDALDAMDLGINEESEQSLDDLQLDADADEFDLGDMDFSLDQDAEEAGDELSLGDLAEEGLASENSELEEAGSDVALEEDSNELSDIEFDLALGGDEEATAESVSEEADSDLSLLDDAEQEDDGLSDIEFESALGELDASLEADLESDLNAVENNIEEQAEEDALAALDDFSLDAAEDSQASGEEESGELNLDFSLDEPAEAAVEEASADAEDGLELDDKTAAVAAAGAAALGATVVGTLTMHDEEDQPGGEAESPEVAADDSVDLALDDTADDFALDATDDQASFDLSAGLDDGLEDELNLDAGGELDLAELDKELDSELGIDVDAELNLDAAEESVESSVEQSSEVDALEEDFSSDFGEELNNDLQGLAGADMDLPSSDLSVGDLAGNSEELGDDLAALDISLGEEGESAEVAESLDDAPEAANELSNELDFLADSDEVATKLDLARAYMDMGDKEGAKEILEEVVNEGDEGQQSEAQELIDRM
ncbi:FimV/HubP family polar landmark protein [Pseudoteredinibacter isoporae]|uniref:Pilus assembly protein FimV n=1 Tax=Pseudoteredinibacter isoporae TaxID=570281 RepID=A0A7X0JXR3_9GAMM|nr:FimV/HubP family polar landmark protein [Pseudoteredinibacter isoporae]MBB6523361.1 pilus assembly protein FimV [Pseudoteredinibacter isoporae]NHO88874.1 hypothetical protein [Pseudoteredinibacter isoporae]NIB24418.1 hypothetical protein [Pseudoteredinibacter isoporae]